MATQIGFYCFTAPTPPVMPTLKERISDLSTAQKTSILNGFVNQIPAEHIDHQLCIPLDLVRGIYDGISDIQEKSKAYMRGEVEITPAVLDADGITVITPAVMNTPPTTQTALGTIIAPLFADIFTSTQVTAIITAMVKASKYDYTGTFAFYQSQIIL